MMPRCAAATLALPITLTAITLATLAGCQSSGHGSGHDNSHSGAHGSGHGSHMGAHTDAHTGALPGTPWSPEFNPPTRWSTPEFVLEPLSPEHNELDFAAAQSSREHLQRTLQWGGWPSADATLDDNRSDLEGHLDEFNNRIAYAYTVLSPDRSACLGCVYINPVGKKGQPEHARRARVAFWVIESQLANNLDTKLVAAVLNMLAHAYPIDQAEFSIHVQNARGVSVLTSLGLTEAPAPSPTHRLFVWNNGPAPHGSGH
jgi:hypothetical protein